MTATPRSKPTSRARSGVHDWCRHTMARATTAPRRGQRMARRTTETGERLSTDGQQTPTVALGRRPPSSTEFLDVPAQTPEAVVSPGVVHSSPTGARPLHRSPARCPHEHSATRCPVSGRWGEMPPQGARWSTSPLDSGGRRSHRRCGLRRRGVHLRSIRTAHYWRRGGYRPTRSTSLSTADAVTPVTSPSTPPTVCSQCSQNSHATASVGIDGT